MLVCAAISYLIGSLPFGLWVGLLWKGVDIRTLGSKNIGATNVLRVLGPGPASVAFLLDTAKGAAGILLTDAVIRIWFGQRPPLPALMCIGLVAILGHTFSLFLRFKGGKGVATSLGVLLALCPWVALVGLVTWIAFVAATRYVSLASLAAAFSLPFAAHFTIGPAGDRLWMIGMGVALFVLVTVKHRANIQRLLAGTESKIGQRVAPLDSPDTVEVR